LEGSLVQNTLTLKSVFGHVSRQVVVTTRKYLTNNQF